MAPKWFPINDLPYESMWEADRQWIPEILKGYSVRCEFIFDLNNHLIYSDIEKVDNFD